MYLPEGDHLPPPLPRAGTEEPSAAQMKIPFISSRRFRFFFMLKWIAALPLGAREPPALVFKAADRNDINSVFPLIGIIADSCEYHQEGRDFHLRGINLGCKLHQG